MGIAVRRPARPVNNRTVSRAILVILLLIAVLPAISGSAAASASPSLQSDEITRLEAQAAELEGRAARLRRAIENCRRSITPQSPECLIEISWMRTTVPYQEAERIATNLEQQARDIRGRIEYLRRQQSQPSPPPPPPVNVSPTTPTSPPATGTPPSSGTSPTRPTNQTVQTPVSPAPTPRPVPEPRVGGLSRREWNQLLSFQQRLEELYKDYDLNRTEADKLRDQILQLWKRAMSGPLTPEQRKMLRIRLPVRSQPAGIVKTDRSQLNELIEKRPPSVPPPPSPLSVASDLVQSHLETGAQQAFDEFGKNWAEAINLNEVERKYLNYDNVIGLSRISLKLKDKDYAGAISETVDFIVGKVALPLTSMNISVFKSVYGQTTFGALNKFMEDSMRMTGAEFSYEEMTRDMNLGQKAVLEWVGWGDLMREKDREREKR